MKILFLHISDMHIKNKDGINGFQIKKIADSKENTDLEISKIEKKWNEVHEKLAYYIEHDELEKVENNFTACKSLADTGEFNQAICELEKMKFVLEHITDKYSFNWVNIF